MSGKCVVCETDTTKQCSNCHEVFYCSKNHQAEHRKTHKADCKPVQMKESKQLGRYLIASKNFKEGEILFKEKSIAIGPSMIVESPMCLDCYKPISAEDSYFPCPKCGWPMCDEGCCSSPDHKPECDLIVAHGYKVDLQSLIDGFPLYQCVVVMRCLYLKNAKPEMWDKLMKLESYPDEVSLEEIYLPIAFILKSFLKGDTFTFEEISKVCRIILVNGFSSSVKKGKGIICIYNTTSFFEHSCLSNCNEKVELSGNKIVITAAVDIKAGEHVSICYTYPMYGTLQRRQELKNTKFFNCHCQRCEDVTEMGTMYGALKCQKENCGGYVLPKSFILEKQTEFDWFCNKCTTVLKSDSAEEIYDRIKEEYYAVEKDMSYESLKRFLRNNLKFVSNTHELIVRAKFLFAKIFNNSIQSEILEEDLELTRDFIEDVSNVFDVLLPGKSESIGFILITLLKSWIEDSRRKMNNPEHRQCPELFLDYLMNYKKILQKLKIFLEIGLHQTMFVSATKEVFKCLAYIDKTMRSILMSGDNRIR